MSPRLVVLAGKLHPYGGIETHLFHYCLAVQNILPVTLIITSRQYNAKSIAVLRDDGVEVREFACGKSVRGLIEYAKCLKLLATRFRREILYSNGTSGFSFLAKLAMSPRLWIHQHHGDITSPILETFSPLYRRSLEGANSVILCTNGHVSLLQETLNRKQGVLSLPYLKDEPEDFAVAPTITHGDKRVVGFFGRLRESKGIDILMRLSEWFYSQNIECRLHGDNCEGLVSDPLPRGLSWHGPYDSATDLGKLLAAVDMIVLPTNFPEGLPIVVSEAISRGVPVVCFPGGGLREMENFHPGVLVVPPTVEELKSGILEMLRRSREPGLANGLVKQYREMLSNAVTLDWWEKVLRTSLQGRAT